MFGSTKKKTQVFSNTYSSSQDIEEGDTYLQSKLVASIFDPLTSITDALFDVIFNGPASNLRTYKNYGDSIDYVGNIESTLGQSINVDIDTVEDYILAIDPPVLPTDQLVIMGAVIEPSDLDGFALNYLYDNFTEEEVNNLDYSVELFDDFTIRIEYADTTFVDILLTEEWSFENEYLYVEYLYYYEDYNDPIVTGVLIETDTLPDTSDYTLVSDTDTIEPVTLNTTEEITSTFDNGDPDVVTTNNSSSATSFTKNETIKTKLSVVDSILNDRTTRLEETYHEFTDYNIVENVTTVVETIDHGTYIETKTTVTTSDVFETVTSYRIDEQTQYTNRLRSKKFHTYLIGSGQTTIDNLVTEDSTDTSSNFYPSMPLRVSNISLRDLDYYDETKSMYDKLNGGNIDDVLETLESNSDIGQIDHAFIQLGFAANTPKQDELKYIYEFLKYLINYQTNTETEYNTWRANSEFKTRIRNVVDATPSIPDLDQDGNQIGTKKEYFLEYRSYMASLGYSTSWVTRRVYDFASNYMTIRNSFKFKSIELPFNLTYEWNYIKEDTFTGLARSGASVGDIFWSDTPPNGLLKLKFFKYRVLGTNTKLFYDYGDLEQYLYYQTDVNTYKVLTVSGLGMRNHVYGKYSTYINIGQAVNDGEPSKMIIPLHVQVIEESSIIDRNELVLRSINFVFNSIVITKVKWYARSWFRIVLIIAIIVIVIVVTIITVGKGTGPTVKLGAAILGALGVTTFSVALAAIIGAIASMLISFILAELLKAILSSFLPEEDAALLASISAAIITAGITGGFELANIVQLLSDPIFIANIAIAIAENVMVKLFMDDITSVYNEVQRLEERIEDNEELIENYNELYDLESPTSLLETTIADVFFGESYEEFHTRTNMSGEDIVELTLSYVEDFVNISINTENKLL